ncbi:MAG: VWA domain-containing protein [Bryobacteraceae bacterium]
MSKSKTFLSALAVAAFGLLAQAQDLPVLMHLNPVALDASGQPVTDLTAADFKIVDNGKPETIYFFHKPDVGPAAPLAPLERTNRPNGVMPHTTAILFDMINLVDADRLESWKYLDKSLPQLESGENVYFYVLNLEGTMIPIHAIGPRSADDKTWPQGFTAAFDKVMKASSHARPVQFGSEDQVKKSFKALEDIAGQLAQFPGRRDILWVANGITTVPDPMLPNCNGDWVECSLYVPHLAVTLANAGVAVDPYSYIGDINPDVNYNMDQMSLLTGGKGYFRQDIKEVLKQVAQNSVNSYTIYYNPSAANWDKKWHHLHLTCERKGVKVQVRERYYALPDSRAIGDRMKAALINALGSPADLCQIGLRAKFAPLEGGKPGVHIDVTINASDLLMREDGGKFKSAVYFVMSDRSAGSPIGEPVLLNLSPELTAEQHASVLKDGLPFSQDHPLTGAVQFVRVILLDQNTNAVGAITFPVK